MYHEPVNIIKLTLSDLVELRSMSVETFYESFREANTEENMQQYMSDFFSSDKLSAEINNPDSEFYFARLNEIPVGYLKVNFGKAQTEMQDKKGLEIERIYVKAGLQGKKIGQLLFDKALQIAQERGVDYLWLGVWEKNPGAIKFYERNGMRKFASHLFKLGDDVQTDIMMKLDLPRKLDR
ncbi:MAG: GNAT family N-acetyltransferase [Ferruginibacter sp.]